MDYRSICMVEIKIISCYYSSTIMYVNALHTVAIACVGAQLHTSGETVAMYISSKFHLIGGSLLLSV